MRRWAAVGLTLLLMGVASGCSDRLADMQARMQGTWVLETRELSDGTRLGSPQIRGMLSWAPIDSRKAHVTVNLLVEEASGRTFDYAASTYEISTSAITRKRHLLIRQGYRSSAEAPITVYPKAKTAKGKISQEGAIIKITDNERSWEFSGDVMTWKYAGVYVDTWKRKR